MDKKKVKQNIERVIDWLRDTGNVTFYPVGLLENVLKELEKEDDVH